MIEPEPIGAESFYSISLAQAKHWTSVTQVFSRQVDAFDAYDRLEPWDRCRCKAFSYEAPSSGKRHFLLTDLNTFYRQYNGTDGEHRHVYELIRHTFPCRLYFDLEYQTAFNPGINGNQIVLQWIHLVLWKIYEYYDICLGLEHVLVLDSSTPEKFSKHIHFLLLSDTNKEFLFPNNLEIGFFVQRIMTDITIAGDFMSGPYVVLQQQPRLPKPCSSSFFINTEAAKQCIVDLGVYTRNRAFRLFNCCKYGKVKRLTIAPSDRQAFPLLSALSSTAQPIRSVLEHTFVIPADLFLSRGRGKRKREIGGEKEDKGGEGERGEGGVMTFTHLADFLNSTKYSILPVLDPLDSPHSLCRASLSSSKRELRRSAHPSQSSPFPLLDTHLTPYVKHHDTGYISSWHLYSFVRGGLSIYMIRYNVQGNRYCECKQRPHKSNGIYFEVNLCARELTQGCYDVECKGFGFTTHQVPIEVLPHSPEEIEKIVAESNLL